MANKTKKSGTKTHKGLQIALWLLFILAIIGVLASVVGAFYYLRIVKIIYFDEPKESYDGFSFRSLNVLFYPSSLAVILFCIYPLPIINIANFASKSFF